MQFEVAAQGMTTPTLKHSNVTHIKFKSTLKLRLLADLFLTMAAA